MSDVQPENKRTRLQDDSTGRHSFDVATKLVPAAVAATYLYGFLVLTSHLGDFGITTTGILDASYFIAGATFVYLIATYVIFLFRPVRALAELIKAGPQAMSRHTEPTSLDVICFLLYLLIEICVHMCLAAFVFSSVLVDSTRDASSRTLPMLLVLIVFSGYLTGRLGSRLWHYNLISASRIAIIVWFFVAVATLETWSIFGILGVLSALFDYVIKELQVRKGSPEQQAYLIGFCALMLTAVAMFFGNVVYGNIKRDYGGGAPVSATISIHRDQIGHSTVIDKSPIAADVVHVSDTDLYLVLADSQYVILSRSAVLGIRLLDPGQH